MTIRERSPGAQGKGGDRTSTCSEASGTPPPGGAVAGVETCSEGIPQLYVLHWARKPRSGDTGRGTEARADMLHLEKGVHVMSCTGAGAQGAWRGVVPDVAERAGGNVGSLGPVITSSGFITKTIEGH